MAARQLQRRILSLFSSRQITSYLPEEFPRQFIPSRNSLSFKHDYFRRGVQTLTEFREQPSNDLETHEAPDSSASAVLPNSAGGDTPALEFNAISNLKTSPRHDLAMIYTCKVCETRSIKTVCRESYEKGVVVVRCGGCNNLHLIADHLGWFGEPGNIEDLLAARGEEVKKGSVDSLNLTLQDLAGKKL
ncbi:hypothetical protein NMG60_11018652 [Bertholletia excelsa]